MPWNSEGKAMAESQMTKIWTASLQMQSAQIPSIESQDQHHQPIHRVFVNGRSTILRFYGKNGADIAVESWLFQFWPSFEIQLIILPIAYGYDRRPFG